MAEVISLHLEILLNYVALPVLATLVTHQIAEKLLNGPLKVEELSSSTEINPNRLFRYLRIASNSGFFYLIILLANEPIHPNQQF